MNILRSIDIDKVFDSVEIKIDGSLSEIFSASVDKDLIPVKYELKIINGKNIALFSYEFEEKVRTPQEGIEINAGNRGVLIRQMEYQDKNDILSQLQRFESIDKYNKENIAVLKFIVNNFWES